MRSIILAFAILGNTLAISANDDFDPEAVKEKIRQNWKAREERIKTVRAEWQQEVFTAQGAIYPPEVMAHRESTPATLKTGLPEKDFKDVKTWTLITDGLKCNSSTTIYEYTVNQGPIAKPFRRNYDGEQSISSSGENASGLIKISEASQKSDLKGVEFCGIMFWMRPLDLVDLENSAIEPFMEDPSRYLLKVKGKIITLDAKNYNVHEQASVNQEGKIWIKLTVDYSTEETESPPVSWTRARIQDGRIVESGFAHNLVIKLNTSIDQSEYRIEIPEGKKIYEIDGKKYFYIMPDGSRRYLDDSEERLPYERLIEAQNSQGANYSGYYLMFAALAAVLVLLLMFRFRRREFL